MRRGSATRKRSMKETMRLRREARRGNPEALQRLQAKSALMARRANKMLDLLQKAGLTKQAYRAAQTFTSPAYGSTRYSENLTDADAMYQQLLSIEHFLSLRTSTIAGSKEVENERISTFRQRYKRAQNMTRRQILDFFDFLDDENVSDFIDEEGYYESKYSVDDFLYITNEVGRSKDRVKQAIGLYMERRDNPLYNDKQKFYYDDLINYLHGGIDFRVDKKTDNIIIVKRRGQRL